jgi:hypothetical protein
MIVVILGMVIGVVAIGLFIKALSKKRSHSPLWGLWLTGSIGILIAGFIVFLVGAGMGTTDEVEVELKEWEVNVQPAAVKSGYHTFQSLLNIQKITFEITNTGSMPHEFVIVRADASPGDLLVEDGKVRYYTPWGYPRGHRMPLDRGVFIAPGATRLLTRTCGKHACPPGTSFVLFSNQPGDYERGMYTVFIVTDPPFINTYWWVVLLAVVAFGLLVYFLAIRVRRHV